MNDDFWEEPTAKVWMKHVINETAPKLKSSSIAISLFPSNAEGDVKFWVELGAMIMMDKPILVVAFASDQIPHKLCLVADEVVVLPNGVNPAATQEFKEALQRIMAEVDDKPKE
jgi:hypothetical protein